MADSNVCESASDEGATLASQIYTLYHKNAAAPITRGTLAVLESFLRTFLKKMCATLAAQMRKAKLRDATHAHLMLALGALCGAQSALFTEARARSVDAFVHAAGAPNTSPSFTPHVIKEHTRKVPMTAAHLRALAAVAEVVCAKLIEHGTLHLPPADHPPALTAHIVAEGIDSDRELKHFVDAVDPARFCFVHVE